DRQAQRQSLLAGDRHPPRRLRQRAPPPGRGGQAGRRARALPDTGGLRQAGLAQPGKSARLRAPGTAGQGGAMKRKLAALAAALIVAAALLARTHAAGEFAIDWYSIDGGGSRSSGGSFVLNGSLGQPDAQILSGGTFSLAGGFWPVTLNRGGV